MGSWLVHDNILLKAKELELEIKLRIPPQITCISVIYEVLHNTSICNSEQSECVIECSGTIDA